MLHPGIAAGVAMLILALLVRLALLSLADLSFILPMTAIGYVLAGAARPGISERDRQSAALAGGAADLRRRGAGELHPASDYRQAGGHEMTWVLVIVMVAATVLSDLLQSFEMKRAGEQSVGARGVGRLLRMIVARRYLLLSIFCLAFSFFAFMALVQSAPLSFAVPASASSFILETVLAKLLLKEHIGARRAAGMPAGALAESCCWAGREAWRAPMVIGASGSSRELAGCHASGYWAGKGFVSCGSRSRPPRRPRAAGDAIHIFNNYGASVIDRHQRTAANVVVAAAPANAAAGETGDPDDERHRVPQRDQRHLSPIARAASIPRRAIIAVMAQRMREVEPEICRRHVHVGWTATAASAHGSPCVKPGRNGPRAACGASPRSSAAACRSTP